jgi:hypothetical protein
MRADITVGRARRYASDEWLVRPREAVPREASLSLELPALTAWSGKFGKDRRDEPAASQCVGAQHGAPRVSKAAMNARPSW